MGGGGATKQTITNVKREGDSSCLSGMNGGERLNHISLLSSVRAAGEDSLPDVT